MNSHDLLVVFHQLVRKLGVPKPFQKISIGTLVAGGF